MDEVEHDKEDRNAEHKAAVQIRANRMDDDTHHDAEPETPVE